jgi:hypothetical protein
MHEHIGKHHASLSTRLFHLWRWMNEWGMGHNPVLAPLPSMISCASPSINPLLILHLEWNVGLYLRGRHSSHSVPWRSCPGDEVLNKQRPHNHIGYMWLIHLLLGTFRRWGRLSNLSLKRCLFRWQCPVNSRTVQFNWSLFNFNRSFFLLAEGPDIRPFACVSIVVDSHSFCWLLFVQSLIAFLVTPIEMPLAGSGPMNGCTDPILISWSAVSLPTILSWTRTHISWTALCFASCMRDW